MHPAAVACFREAVNVEDGEQIRSRFGFWAVSRLVENQELPTVLLNHELEQLESKPAQSVTAGNHNRELKDAIASRFAIAAHNSDQYGPQSFPLEVESRADVLDDFSCGVGLEHELDLTGEVIPLLN
jgi:hypothetical protein